MSFHLTFVFVVDRCVILFSLAPSILEQNKQLGGRFHLVTLLSVEPITRFSLLNSFPWISVLIK